MDRERRTGQRLGVDDNETTALFDDAVDHGESKSHPLSLFLGREERLEDTGHCVTVHADPGIRDRQAGIPSRIGIRVGSDSGLIELDGVGLNGQYAAIWHGIACVEYEVGDDLLDLRTVNADVRQVPVQTQADLQLIAKERTEEIASRFDRLIEAKHCGSLVLGPAECEQLVRELSRNWVLPVRMTVSLR